MALILILLYTLWITPLRAGIDLRADKEALTGRAGILIWGLRRQTPLRVARGADRRLQIQWLPGRMPLVLSRKPGKRGVFSSVWRSRTARRVLTRGVRVRSEGMQVVLGGQDAARIAWAAGLIRAVSGAFPQLRLSCVPAFGGRFSVHAVCIADARLGTLCTAWLFSALEKRAAGKKEEQAWIVPSNT